MKYLFFNYNFYHTFQHDSHVQGRTQIQRAKYLPYSNNRIEDSCIRFCMHPLIAIYKRNSTSVSIELKIDGKSITHHDIAPSMEPSSRNAVVTRDVTSRH